MSSHLVRDIHSLKLSHVVPAALVVAECENVGHRHLYHEYLLLVGMHLRSGRRIDEELKCSAFTEPVDNSRTLCAVDVDEAV